MLGSSVLPDLLDTRNNVFLRSTLFSNVLICDGSVESSTCSLGKPGFEPNVSAKTSGPRLDPPMPSNRTSVKPAFLTSVAKFCSAATPFNCSLTTPSQPTHFASSVSVHSEASAAHSRRTLPSLRQSSSAALTSLSIASGNLTLYALSLPPSTAWRFFCTA